MRAGSRYERDSLNVPSTDGVTVVVHDLSDESYSRVPVLLVHATGFHGYVWQPFADHLRQHHAYAPDLRGHGDATAPVSGDFAWTGFADDVLAMIKEALNQKPASIAVLKAALEAKEETPPAKAEK